MEASGLALAGVLSNFALKRRSAPLKVFTQGLLVRQENEGEALSLPAPQD